MVASLCRCRRGFQDHGVAGSVRAFAGMRRCARDVPLGAVLRHARSASSVFVRDAVQRCEPRALLCRHAASRPCRASMAAALFLASALAAQRSLVLRGEEDGGWTLDPTVARALFRDLWHPSSFGTTICASWAPPMLQISGFQDIFGHVPADIALGECGGHRLSARAGAFVRKPPNLTRVHLVALVSAAGFLLLPLIWNAAGGIFRTPSSRGGAMVAGLSPGACLADASHRTRTSPILLFSVAFLATKHRPACRNAVGWANAETLRQGDLALTAIALVSVYLLLLAAIVLFRNRSGASGAALRKGEDASVTPEEASPAMRRVGRALHHARGERHLLLPRPGLRCPP